MPIAQPCSSIPHKAGKEILGQCDLPLSEAILDTTRLGIALLSKSVDKTATFNNRQVFYKNKKYFFK